MYLASSDCSSYIHGEADFDLSGISSDQGYHETSMGQNFVEELLGEMNSSDVEPSINPAEGLSTAPHMKLDDWHEYNCPSVFSTCHTVSSSSGESIVSDDEGFVSLDQCSASLSDFLDPEDFSALLDTLSAALPSDALTSPVVLGGACYNLSQCTNSSQSVSNSDLQIAMPIVYDVTKEASVLSQPEANLSKPDISYIELVAKAIMDSSDNSILLADIYQWIEDNFPYYKVTKNSWRNSIRHNLSVNECFVKNKRVKNGRGFYWSIHSSCIDAFKRGDFDRRKARRQVQQCNRAFSSAFEELQELTQMKGHRETYHSSSVPQFDQTFQIGSRNYIPSSSTPIRGQQFATHQPISGYSSYSGGCWPC